MPTDLVLAVNVLCITYSHQLSDSDIELAMTDIEGNAQGGDRSIEFDEMIDWLEREGLWDREKAK